MRHQLLVYNPNIDEEFFVDEFLTGLKDDIRSAIWLHRSKDMDTASALAFLQEEELEPLKRRAYQKQDGKDFSRSSLFRFSDRTKGLSKFDEPKKSDPSKLDSLHSYRRDKGLCFTCGDKWSRAHKCP